MSTFCEIKLSLDALNLAKCYWVISSLCRSHKLSTDLFTNIAQGHLIEGVRGLES